MKEKLSFIYPQYDYNDTAATLIFKKGNEYYYDKEKTKKIDKSKIFDLYINGNLLVVDSNGKYTKVVACTPAGTITEGGGDISPSAITYPDYCETEKDRVLAQLEPMYSIANPIVIGFSTDQHIIDTDKKVEDDVLPAIRTLRDLTKEFPFNLCVLGGDSTSTSSSISALQQDVLKVSNALEGANCPVIHLIGNHDGKGNIPSITASAVFSSHRTNAIKNKAVTTVDEGTNCYYDDESCQVRFIFFVSTSLNGYNNTTSRSFLANALETLPQGYEAIIFSHHPVGNLTDDPSTRVDDWNEPLGWGETVNPYADRIIACISGHVHDDRAEIKDGILYLSTTCAGNRELNDGSTRVHGTVDATAYDVFVIDRTAHTIHCIRYGNGENRDIVYRIPTYTNVLPLAIDTDNTVYNSKGFGNGRLSSEGAIVETVQANVTGFIPVKAGDIVRLKNCNLDGVNNAWTDKLGFYKSDFTTLNCQYPSKFDETQHDTFQMVTDANGFVTQFTVLSSSAISYIRISSSGINDNSVITVNEPIN